MDGLITSELLLGQAGTPHRVETVTSEGLVQLQSIAGDYKTLLTCKPWLHHLACEQGTAAIGSWSVHHVLRFQIH